MGLLIIDETKCRKDGICTRECPMAILRLKDGDGFPEIRTGGEDICNSCGHCVAVCPHGALSHAQVPIEKSPLIEKDLEIDEYQAVQFLRSRRSIRFFKNQPVEKEKLQRLIEIARYAPTGGNFQMVEWKVFTDAEMIRTIAERTVAWIREVLSHDAGSAPPYMPLIVRAWDMGYNSVTWNAPTLVVAYAPDKAATGAVDVTLALAYFELLAPKLGLGTCWAGLVEGALQASDAVKEAVGLPGGTPHHHPMLVGYPKPKYLRLPERKAPEINWN